MYNVLFQVYDGVSQLCNCVCVHTLTYTDNFFSDSFPL